MAEGLLANRSLFFNSFFFAKLLNGSSEKEGVQLTYVYTAVSEWALKQEVVRGNILDMRKPFLFHNCRTFLD